MNQKNSGIDGFDPLSSDIEADAAHSSVFELATKREVSNILKSYTGYFDVFSEMIQNALDAIDSRRRSSGNNYTGKIIIDIDLQNSKVRVVDNGIGMDRDEYRYCFRPSVSFKNRRDGRGNKGVGATFLAYGFSMIKLASKKNDVPLSGRLQFGRQWVDDAGGSYGRPKFEELPFDIPELSGEHSGTAVEVMIGEGQRPQLTWIQATNARQWTSVLRIKTPLGGVFLTNAKPRDDVSVLVRVKDITGKCDELESGNIEYYYPHEMENLNKVQTLTDIEEKVSEAKGAPAQKFRSLSPEFKRLDAVYEIWTYDEILGENSDFSPILNDEFKEFIARHEISVYGCFLSSAKFWSSFQEDILKVRKNASLLRGGMVIASDSMVQGDTYVIPLTSAIGYQNNSHVIIHLVDGNPDMGRKVFQPEIKLLADELAKRIVTIFRRYLSLLREDTGQPSPTGGKELWQWKLSQDEWKASHPLRFKVGADRSISVVSEPQAEQDVIALFHELLGMNVLKGYRIYSTSEHEKYDCVFYFDYGAEGGTYDKEVNRLGFSSGLVTEGESEPLILEYKYDLDGLISDFDSERKFSRDVDLCVCWSIGEKYKESYTINSYIVGDEGSGRRYFGATQGMYRGHELVLEILCIKDLFAYFQDSRETALLQQARFSQ